MFQPYQPLKYNHWSNPLDSLTSQWPSANVPTVGLSSPFSRSSHSAASMDRFVPPTNGVSSWATFTKPLRQTREQEIEETKLLLLQSLQKYMPNVLIQQPRKDGTVVIDNRTSSLGRQISETQKEFNNDIIWLGQQLITVGSVVTSARTGPVFLLDFDVRSQSYGIVSTRSPRMNEHNRIMVFEIAGLVDTHRLNHQVYDRVGRYIRAGDFISEDGEKCQASCQVVEVYNDHVFTRSFRSAGVKMFQCFKEREVFRTMNGQSPATYRSVIVPPDHVKAKTRSIFMVDDMIHLYGLKAVQRVCVLRLQPGDFIDRNGRVAIITAENPDTMIFICIGHMQTAAFEKRALGMPKKLVIDEKCLWAKDKTGRLLAVGYHVVLDESISSVRTLATVFACFNDHVVLQVKNSDNGMHTLSLPARKTMLVADYIEQSPIETREQIQQQLYNQALTQTQQAFSGSPTLQEKSMPLAEERLIDFWSARNGRPTSTARFYCRAFDFPQPVAGVADVTYEIGCRPWDNESLSAQHCEPQILPVRDLGYERKIKPLRGESEFLSGFPPNIITRNNIHLKETIAMVPFWLRDHLRALEEEVYHPPEPQGFFRPDPPRRRQITSISNLVQRQPHPVPLPLFGLYPNQVPQNYTVPHFGNFQL